MRFTRISFLLMLAACLLSASCRDRSQPGPRAAEPIPEGIAKACESFETSLFEKITERSRSGSRPESNGFVQGARGMTAQGKAVDLGTADPRDKVRTLITRALDFASEQHWGVRYHGILLSFFGNDPNMSLKDRHFTLAEAHAVQEPNVQGGSESRISFSAPGTARYANVLLAFGHRTNPTLQYVWHIVYDMKQDYLCLTTTLCYAEPVPVLPEAPLLGNPVLE
jgi:hypothetical protein